MKMSESVDKILPAIFKVKSKLESISKDAANPFFNSSYADLNTHLEAVEPLLAANDMILLQPVCMGENHDYVESLILHSSGQWISSQMRLVNTPDMQKAGSAVTYARRYTLGALLSIKTEDDDGEAAVGRSSSGPAKKWPSKAPVASKPKAETPAAASPAKQESKPIEPKPFDRSQIKAQSSSTESTVTKPSTGKGALW